MAANLVRDCGRGCAVVHLKLNEIVAALEGASNRLIDVEDLTEEELDTLHKHYQKLVQMANKDFKLTQSHSVEEAEAGTTSSMVSIGIRQGSGRKRG